MKVERSEREKGRENYRREEDMRGRKEEGGEDEKLSERGKGREGR